ncbi:MAG: dihydrofolate synthase / folylpolyglutamate synthase [Actinomycetota bacterium]|nr:dihydrofolate synthase / folylpolyglutamate synthase [Actinomycetota bacterium]
MSFKEAEAYLDSLGIDAMKSMAPTLHRVEAVCEALNNPQDQINAIHVTGTNGKTTTSRIATSLLAATGLRVGTYTSPHLESVRERIALNGTPISEEAFGEVFDHLMPFVQVVEERLGEQLSYFEILTAMFFLWASENVDVSVVEVGLGGEWDATNVIQAPVAVITNIGLDHVQLLGQDRATIAREKAGIIKQDAFVVTGERDPAIVEIFREKAEAKGATLRVLDKDFTLTLNELALGGRYISVAASGGISYKHLFLPLHGAHQGVNAAVAIEAVTSFMPSVSLDEEVIAAGLATVKVSGRIETVPGKRVPVVLDVAHNPDGMSALVTSLAEAFAFGRVVFVVGILKDKDYKGMLAEMARIPSALVLTEPRFARSAPAEELLAASVELGLSAEVVQDVPGAVDRALTTAEATDLVCVTGSHYVVGEARPHLVGGSTATVPR